MSGLRHYAGVLESHLKKVKEEDPEDLVQDKEFLEYSNILPPPIPDSVLEKIPEPIEPTIDQANGCYLAGWFDACGTMLRKALANWACAPVSKGRIGP